MNQFLDHMANDVMPALLDRLSADGKANNNGAKECIDPKSYWAEPESTQFKHGSKRND
jgi:hypothetical protein